MKAVIVGGGIGGLASAVALSRAGWQVEVLERAPDFTEVGAGLSLWQNGLRALDALGVGQAVRERSLLQGQAGVRDAAGRWLARTGGADLDRRYGPAAMVHRADLLAILRSALPASALRGGITVSRVRSAGRVWHSAGESKADLVVGADGIRSIVRASSWPDAPVPRYAGYTAWRLIAPALPVTDSGETWGAGERFGYAPLPDGRIYAYATANAPPGEAGGGLAGLRRRFGHWHHPIPALLEAAADGAVLHDDLYELPPLRSFTTGTVALVGDAAHAMTPNLGQGAGQALEDAVVLAKTVDTGSGREVRTGLEAYDRLRRPRAQMIVLRSHRVGAVGQWASPAAVTLRNAGMRLMPRSAFIRSLAPVLDWTA
ncbi:MAG TPA: FAD-dependent monooxygenase [Streptosporangiaceae bacterium]|nr:FAD-dependent monooxygenase [Streptosporangiaceae bacterium]